MTREEIPVLPAGRERDRMVAEAMGDVILDDDPERSPWWVSQDGSKCCHEDGGPRRYSTEISDAWKVVEKMVADGHRPVVSLDGEDWWCRVNYRHGNFDCESEATTPAHAICLTFLKLFGDRP